ncbi:MAG: translation initiation factor IF-2, partial [Cellvibrionales bacterium]|nr:translation initiation factor IF-2 [Cellvibrionales bacterium]
MTQITVSQLARKAKKTEEQMLAQMQDAGLRHSSAGDAISAQEMQALLRYLNARRGAGTEATPEAKKITLKNKETQTLRVKASAGGKKMVNVQTRKKRTYVKQTEAEVQAQAQVEQQAQQQPASTPATPPPPAADSALDDAEQRRLNALEVRRKADEAEQARREAEAAKKRETTEARQHDPESKTTAPATPTTERERTTAKPASRRTAAPASEPATRKRRARGRARVQSEHESKDWRKHSHRPQDFALREDEEFEAEERARERAAEVAKLRAKNKHTFTRPTVAQVHEVALPETIQVGELARRCAVKSGELIKQLMNMGEMASVTDSIDQDTAALLVEELGHKPVLLSATEVEDSLIAALEAEINRTEEARAPVVAVMGHVDHGKTSLLDTIRKSQVAAGEAGGITQHIGAYVAATKHGKITFLDTPGHAAFTAMRARGANCTDLIILVVAADDGVMPQTEEAVQHARAAKVPLIVAVNKIDKEGADPEQVKTGLARLDVTAEDWGGDVQFVPVSAHTGEGVEALLQAVSLQAELLELQAPASGAASGVIIESRVEKGRGAVCTALVQRGQLERGDILLAGDSFGRIRAMTDETGAKVNHAGPSVPVEVIGLDSAPDAGDEFLVVPDERKAREVADFRRTAERTERQSRQQKASLETMFADMGGERKKKLLSVVLKADVRGSAEALTAALGELGNAEVGVELIPAGVGGISESDINLALTTGSIVVGFNVRANGAARRLAEREHIEIRY